MSATQQRDSTPCQVGPGNDAGGKGRFRRAQTVFIPFRTVFGLMKILSIFSPPHPTAQHLDQDSFQPRQKWRQLLALGLGLLMASSCSQPQNRKSRKPSSNQAAVTHSPSRGGMALPVLESKGMRMLYLGDSMSLGGFGDRLDHLLRIESEISQLHTYLACGVFPLSWTQIPPFAGAKTGCGYCSIVPGYHPLQPQRFDDVHGKPSGNVPSSHPVPKIEHLLQSVQPEVWVLQLGNNFFSCFKDKRSIQEDYHRKYIRSLTTPFLRHLLTASPSLKRIYWITPPQAGSVSWEIQDFVYNEIAYCAADFATLIDSRKLTHYPYKVMDRDQEHFWGGEAEQWAERVHQQILSDLVARPIERQEPLIEICRRNPPRILQGMAAVTQGRPILRVTARLVACTPIPDPSAFPYGEFLVGYRYRILKKHQGEYREREILVMHPSYVKKTVRDLSAYKIGQSYELELVEIDDKSLWAAVNRQDSVGEFDMVPFIQVADEALHPEHAKNR